MLRRRFIRQPSEAPVAIGVTVGGCSRGDAETVPRRLKHRLNRWRINTGRRFNRWLRKISAELQTLLLIQIFKTKAINTQFGPFSRDNLTPQTLILIVLESFYIHIGKLRFKRGLNTKIKCMSHFAYELRDRNFKFDRTWLNRHESTTLILSLLWRWYIIFRMNIFLEVWFAPLWCY